MKMNLEGKLALVTGSTKGIGKAIAIELAKEGTNVIINGRQKVTVDKVVAEIKENYPDTDPQSAPYDLSDAKQRKELFERFPDIDILVNASEEAIMPSGEMPQYSLTKTMNLSIAKSLSAGTHVTVNTIMPGSTLTEGVETMINDMYKDSDLPKEEWESDFMKNHRPLSQIQRLIRPEEIGRFVTFVASPYASSFSGEALRLDGGLVPTIF